MSVAFKVFSDDWRKLKPVFWFLGAGIVVESIFASADDRRPVGAFFEHFVASVLYWGVLVGGIAAGIYAGVFISGKSQNKIMGWIFGIIVWLALSILLLFIFSKIPGVGWRIDRLLNRGDF